MILDEQAPPFEGRVAARMSEALWFDSAADLVGAGVDYFGPVGRKRRRPLAGFSKADVADTTNVVWLDIDPPSDAAVADDAAPVDAAGRWLEALRALGLGPSVFLFSGRGCWAYWKLDRHVPQAEAEELMRRLYAQFRPGGAEHDIGRVARMPGSVNGRTGLPAFVMAVDAAARWDRDAIGALLVPPEMEPADGRTDGTPVVNFDLRPSGRLPELPLPPDLAGYLAARPAKRERARLGLDGSSLEQAIVARLVNRGCSDGQIARYFDHHRLPRHEEEKPRRGYRWLAVGIARARARVVPAAPSVSIGKGTYSGDERPAEGYGEREMGWQGRRWVILRDMPEGLPKLELLAWVQERYELRRSQARRELDWLQKEKGYIAALPDERDRRIKRVHRTEAGRRRLQTWRGLGVPVEFLKGLEDPARPRQAVTPAEREAAPDVGPARKRGPKRPRSAAAEKRAADRAEERRRERSLINDVYRIHIPGGRWTYLQLLLPLDEWAHVRLHEQLRVGIDDDGFAVHRSFVSPKDPALAGADAGDPIEERTLADRGFEARDRRIGIAAELVRSDAGFELATRIEGGKALPNVGLVVQADKNFYKPLRAYRKRQDRVIAARKRGKGKATSYEFMVAGDPIEIPDGLVPDLDPLLHRLADEEEMRAVLDSLPDGWRLVKRLPW